MSIPASIAEGFRRWSKPDKARSANIAEGSVEECRCFLIPARDLVFNLRRHSCRPPSGTGPTSPARLPSRSSAAPSEAALPPPT
ncbi:MAG: four helix bundle protein [Bryobacterales bacterium]|nr:four helix bundle protein [Bryobacterales bacterium]